MYKNWKDAIPLKVKLYELHSAGGPLHCSMDDGNLDDETIDWEISNIDTAPYDGGEHAELCTVAMELALVLKQMSMTQRHKIYDSVYA